MPYDDNSNSHSSPFTGGPQWWLDLCKDFDWQPVRQVHPIDLREDADAIAALEQQMQRSQRETRDRIASLRTDLAIAQQEKQSLLRAIEGERKDGERRSSQKRGGSGGVGLGASGGSQPPYNQPLPQLPPNHPYVASPNPRPFQNWGHQQQKQQQQGHRMPAPQQQPHPASGLLGPSSTSALRSACVQSVAPRGFR